MNTKNKPFQCASCDKSYTTRRRLRQHLKISHGPPDPQATCQICNTTFFNKTSLQTHKRIFQHFVIDDVIASKTKEFMCELCNFQTDRGKDLDKHFLSTHCLKNGPHANTAVNVLFSLIKNFECPFKKCTAKTYSKVFMRHHFQTVHCSDEAFKNFLHTFVYKVCDVCNQEMFVEEFTNHVAHCNL